MALSRISDFEFFALSTDVEDSKIPGLSVIGAKVFFTDTQAWSVVQSDLTLADYILPVSITSGPGGGLTDEELRATPVPVTGEFTITGALTDAELRATPIAVTGDFTSGGLTDAQLRASVVPVRTDPTSVTAIYDGGRTATVTAASALKVDGSAVTQPVSGPLTDTQLRATAVPVSLSSVPSHAVTGPLTDTQLRATAVPVSLSSVPSHAVTGPLTDAQLRATAVPVSGTVTSNLSATDNAVLDSIDAHLASIEIAVEDTSPSAVSVANGADFAIGSTTDSPASSSVAEDATARGGISLWKAIKNILILINEKLVAGTTIGATQDAGPAWTSSWLQTTSADATGKVAITAAPTAGQKICIDDIIVSVGSVAMTVTFEEETSATAAIIVYMPSNSTLQLTPRGKLKLATANKRLMIDTSVVGAISVTTTAHSEA